MTDIHNIASSYTVLPFVSCYRSQYEIQSHKISYICVAIPQYAKCLSWQLLSLFLSEQRVLLSSSSFIVNTVRYIKPLSKVLRARILALQYEMNHLYWSLYLGPTDPHLLTSFWIINTTFYSN